MASKMEWVASSCRRYLIETFRPRWACQSSTLLLAAFLRGGLGALHRASGRIRVIHEPLRVELRERGPFGRHVVGREDGVHRARGQTSVAVHALLRVDEELLLTLVDAVDR